MKNYTRGDIFIVLVIFLLLLSGCAKPGGMAAQGIEGTISISGAWALYPMMVTWSEEYNKFNPEIRFDISAGGAGKGMADALAGAVDIGMVSRQIYPEEEAMGAFWTSVTKDAVFLTVNEKNPVWEELRQRGISRDTLVGIYITGEVTNWGQVVGRPEITDPIHVFTRSDAAGAPATWAEYLGKKQEDLLGIGVYGDPGLLEAVIKDPLGIGYNNLNYAFDTQTGLPVAGAQVVPLDVDNDQLADPTEVYDTKDMAVQAVAADFYPSPPARELNLVTKGKPVGEVLEFIKWILTDGQQFVDEAGYIALPSEMLNEELIKLE